MDTGSWIIRFLESGDMYRDEPLADGIAGVEFFDGTIFVDTVESLANLGRTLADRFGSTDDGNA